MRFATYAFTALAMLTPLLLVSCKTSAEDTSPTPMADAVHLRVEVPKEARIGDLVDLRLVVVNQSETVAELSGALAYHRYGFVVQDSAGQQVWRSRFGQPVPLALTRWTIAPSQEIVYEESWGTTGNDGKILSPGTYFIQGEIRLTGGSATSEPVEITILP